MRGPRKTPGKAVFPLGAVLKTAPFHLLNKSTFIITKLSFLAKVTAAAATCPQARHPKVPPRLTRSLSFPQQGRWPPRPQAISNVLANTRSRCCIAAGARPSTGSPSPPNPAGPGSAVPARTRCIGAGSSRQHAPWRARRQTSAASLASGASCAGSRCRAGPGCPRRPAKLQNTPFTNPADNHGRCKTTAAALLWLT